MTRTRYQARTSENTVPVEEAEATDWCSFAIPPRWECCCRKGREPEIDNQFQGGKTVPRHSHKTHTHFITSSYFTKDKLEEGAYFVRRTHFGTRLDQDSKRRLLY